MGGGAGVVLSTEGARDRESRPVAIVTKTDGPSLPESLLSASDTLLMHVPFLSPLYIHG